MEDDVLRSTLPAWCPQSPSSLSAVRLAALTWLRPTRTDRVLELGCGIGTNTLALCRQAHSVLGIDRCRQAVDDAQFNALSAGLSNAEFRVGWAHRAVVRLLGTATFDAALCHGMREPFGLRAMNGLSALKPKRILFLSPSPRSLAKDLAGLSHYNLVRLGLIDQTPGAPNVLTLALMERTEAAT